MALNSESMQTDAAQPTQDLNLRFYSDGVKTNRSTAQKKRRAFNDDISNPGKPSAEQQQGVKERSQGEQSISVVDEDKNSSDPLSDFEDLYDHDHGKCIQAEIATEKNYLYFSQFVRMFEEVEKEMNARYFSKANWMNAGLCFEAVSACMPVRRRKPRRKPISKEEYPGMNFKMGRIEERKSEDLPGLGQNSPESPNIPGGIEERKSEDLPGLGQNSPESPNILGRYPRPPPFPDLPRSIFDETP